MTLPTFLDTHQVYEENGEVWDCMLNQVSLSSMYVIHGPLPLTVENFNRQTCRITTISLFIIRYILQPMGLNLFPRHSDSMSFNSYTISEIRK